MFLKKTNDYTLFGIFLAKVEEVKLTYQHLSNYFAKEKQHIVTEPEIFHVLFCALLKELIIHYKQSLGVLCHLISSSQVEMILKP